MAEAENKFNQMIDALVQEKTLGLEGIDAVKKLKEEYERLQQRFQDVCAKYESEHTSLMSLHEINNKLVSENALYQKKEHEITLREQKMTRLEIEGECANKMVTHTLNMFNTVFNNAALKTNVYRNVGIPVPGNPGGNGMCATPGFVHNQTESETRIEEQG